MTVDNIADLKAEPIPPAPEEEIHVLGYYIKGDGGGGIFYWDNTSVLTDNGGTVISPVPAVTTGRWIRVIDNYINVTWFGAKGDGVTNDAPTIQRAINVAQALKVNLHFSEKRAYSVGTPLQITNEINLTMGLSSKILSNYNPHFASPPALIQVKSSNVTLNNIHVDGNLYKNKGIQIIPPTDADIYNLKINGGTLENLGGVGIYLERCFNFEIRELKCNKNMYSPVETVSGEGELGSIRVQSGTNGLIELCEVSNSYGKGIAMNGAKSVTINKCRVLRTTTDAGDALYVGSASENIIWDNCFTFDSLGHGMKLSRACKNVTVRNCDISVPERCQVSAVFFQGAINTRFYNNTVTSYGNALAPVLQLAAHPDPNGGDCRNNDVYGNRFIKEATNHENVLIQNTGESGVYFNFGNKIRDNYIIGGNSGVYVTDPRDLTITGNQIENVLTFGIRAWDLVYTTNKWNNISYNKIIDAPSGAISLRLRNSRVQGNYCQNSNPAESAVSYGIRLLSESFGVIISENIIKGFNHAQIQITQASLNTNILVSENILDCQSIANSIGVDYGAVSGKVINNQCINTSQNVIVRVPGPNVINTGNG